MKFDFDQIAENGLNVQLDDTSWLPSEFDFDRPVFATAFCWKQKSGSIMVEGHYRAVAVLVCDRCLEKFRLPLNLEFNVYAEVRKTGDIPEQDHCCRKTEIETVYLDKPELDLHYFFRQQVLLSMPMKRLCSPDCRGLCDKCGVNLNLYPEKCQCEKEGDSPFKILARIKKS
ncbi:MAG: YceD family protein [Thermodesulfobacteriota bacterium]